MLENCAVEQTCFATLQEVNKMHANKPGTPTEFHDVIGRPRGDVPKNPDAVIKARKMLTDSLPKIEMNEADAAEGGCGVVLSLIHI